MPGHLDVHLAGNGGKVSAEACGDRDRLLGYRDRGWVGITRQRQQNILECHGALLFQRRNLASPWTCAFDPSQEEGFAGQDCSRGRSNRLQEFEGDQRDDSRAERQGEVIGVQRSEGEELACKRPQQAEGQDGGNGGEHRGQGPVWPPQRRQQ